MHAAGEGESAHRRTTHTPRHQVGDVEGSAPWSIQFEAKAKWDAWNSVKGMSKEEAMQKYVDLLTSETPGWNEHECMASFA